MVKKVVIVGGGSAGWMTAAYLSKALRDVEVTLVESPEVPVIGVGEATFSTIKLFFDFLGLDEQDWMPCCSAAYKLAIKFVNWRGDGGHFYHPFQRYEVVDGFGLNEWWLKLKSHEAPFDYSCFVTPALCEARRSPRTLDGRVYDEQVQEHFGGPERNGNSTLAHHRVQYPYAYHFDAALLARFLRDYAVQRGVHQVLDNVINIPLAEDGSIARVETASHGTLEGDLYIDCTGFRGLLINQALGEPFVSFSDSLLCDRAVALRVPVDIERHGIEPFTTATALSAGWIWNIPLYGRIGTGYVYSSQFLSPEEAEREMRAYLAQKVGPAAERCEPNHIRMRIGRCRNSWVKNCVAIGLSSGFVEPLESTGIFFIQHGIEELVRHFPAARLAEWQVQSYNRQVADCIDGVRDFLVIHYRTTDRTDTEFWRSTDHTVLPDSLVERLSLWSQRMPNDRNINSSYHGFEAYSYSVMLLGMNYRPAGSLPVLDHLDPGNALRAFEGLRERSERLQRTLPSQYEYLSHIRRQVGVDAPEGAGMSAPR